MWFDQHLQKVVVRVVYDGPAEAGKTTNLRQLCSVFTPLRRSELATPEELRGRTLLLDWMTVDGGLVGGFGLRCQLVSVPGQARLARRRWAVIDEADVIVFVVESSRRGIDAAQLSLELLRARLAAHPDPPAIVVQANKLDAADAVEPSAVLHALELTGSPVVGARASEGVGVRETAVVAIRAAADRAHQRILGAPADQLPALTDDADAVVERVRALEAWPRAVLRRRKPASRTGATDVPPAAPRRAPHRAHLARRRGATNAAAARRAHHRRHPERRRRLDRGRRRPRARLRRGRHVHRPRRGPAPRSTSARVRSSTPPPPSRPCASRCARRARGCGPSPPAESGAETPRTER